MQACNVLNDLRKAGQLCDAVIRVEDGQFPVHRAIMSACSPYFRALFTNGMHETGEREVTIPGVAAEMMGIIIEFAYTRQAHVSSVNVEQLLPAADQFHVLGLVKVGVPSILLLTPPHPRPQHHHQIINKYKRNL